MARRTSTIAAFTLASALAVGGASEPDSNLRGSGNGPTAPEAPEQQSSTNDQGPWNDLRFIDPFEGFDYDQVVPLEDYPSLFAESAAAAAAASEGDHRILQTNIDPDERHTKKSKHGAHYREPEDGAEATARIVGGSMTSPSNRLKSFAMTLDNKNGQNFRGACGAVLVSAKWALTAAHCISNYRPNDFLDKCDALYIGAWKPWQRGGANNAKNGGEKYQIINVKKVNGVKQIFTHPQHRPGAGSPYDLCLIELENPVDLSAWPEFKPSPIVNYPLTDSGRMARVYGFGQLNYGGEKAEEQMAVDVGYVPQSTCQSQMSEWDITNDMICFGGAGGKDSCGGDSGGPALCDGAVCGIVSWGYKCAEAGRPGIYANVYVLLDWIKSKVDGYSLKSRSGTVTHHGANENLSSGAALQASSSCSNTQVTYMKNKLPKNKSCNVVAKKPANLCHRKIPNSNPRKRVRDICCYACRNNMSK